MMKPQTEKIIGLFVFASLVTAVILPILWFTEFALVLPIKQAGHFAWLGIGVFAYHLVLSSLWQFAAKKNPWNSGRYFIFSAMLPIAWLACHFLMTDNMDGLTFLLNMFLLVPITFFVCLAPYPVVGFCRFLYRAAAGRKPSDSKKENGSGF